MFEKSFHQIGIKKMNGCSFQQVLRKNLRWFLSSYWERVFLRGFILKPTESGQVPLKNNIRDFQNSSAFERLSCFYVTNGGSIERLQFFNFETNFLESKSLFQKTGVPFLVESTRIENAFFSYKTVLSEANIKTNRIVSAKWTCYEKRSFASNYFYFS